MTDRKGKGKGGDMDIERVVITECVTDECGCGTCIDYVVEPACETEIFYDCGCADVCC
jgi:hypothetical protein